MGIRGDLLSADLSNVFQMLALNRKRGRLLVQDQGNFLSHRRFYVAEDRVSLDARPDQRPLPPILVEMGILSYAQYRDLLAKGERYRSDPIQLALRQGLLTEDQRRDAYRRVEEELILDVFLWKNVSFALEEGGADPQSENFFDVNHLIIEAARRQDEWHVADAAGTGRRIFARTGAEEDTNHLDIDAVQHVVLDHVDGVRGSRQIIEATGLSRYFVDLALRGLEEARLVEPLGFADLVSTGDHLVDAGHVEDGLRMFRAAMAFDRRHPALHRRLAAAWLKIGRIAKAAAHYRFCAASLVTSGQRAEAITVCDSILRILPTDFRTLERCADLIASEVAESGRVPPEAPEILEASKKLLAVYVDTGQEAAAGALASRIARALPEDESIVANHARLSLRAGRRDDAVRAYLSVADMRARREDHVGAVEIFRTLANLDYQNRHLYDGRIADLQRTIESGVRRRKRGRLAVVGASLVATVAAAALVWMHLGSRALAELEELPAGTPAEARVAASRYEALVSRWPLTPAAATASRRAADLRMKADELQGKEDAARVEAQRELVRTQHEIRELLRAAEDDMRGRTGNLDRALEKCQRAVEASLLLPNDDPLRIESKKRFDDTGRYLEDGRRLLRDADSALARHEPGEAFRLRLRALRDFALLPEIKDLELPIRITAAPSGALVAVAETGAGGAGPLETTIKASFASLSLTVTADGHAPMTVTLPMPPGRYEIPVWLERSGTPAGEVGSAPVGAVAAGATPPFFLRTDGRPVFLDPQHGTIASRGSGEIQSVALPPTTVQGGIVVATRFRDLRCFDAVTQALRWTQAPFEAAGEILAPMPLADDLVVATTAGEVCRLSGRDGRVLWRVKVLPGIRALATGPRAIALLGPDGQAMALDEKDGHEILRQPGPYVGQPAIDGLGRPIFARNGRGVFGLGTVGETEIASFNATVTAGPVVVAGCVVLATSERELIVVDGRSVRRMALPDTATRITAGPRSRVALDFIGGRLSVVDVGTLTPIVVARIAETERTTPLLLEQALAVADAEGRVTLVTMP